MDGRGVGRVGHTLSWAHIEQTGRFIAGVREGVCDRAPGPWPGEEYPGGTTRWTAAEEEEVGCFSSVPCCETENVSTTEEFGNEKEGGGRDRGRNSQQGNRGKRKRHPKETRSCWLKKESYIEVAQWQAGEDRRRGSAGACHVLGRTWPEQVSSLVRVCDGCLKERSPVRKTLKKPYQDYPAIKTKPEKGETETYVLEKKVYRN
ncbi:hypothetical protein NDU88_004229 [Pleurodeles waltl]|uniref:Uncharacterized protein n=1 Tax=Pleurodeles waltl TaxID=8319 RepID=A0AAV7KXR7_PLEWA|nr:hypothetical protein NDU88_004229 [Pleurodeles waltl]